MKGQMFGHGLLALTLIGMILTVTAEAMEKPSLLLGPSGWDRVDGQDHDLDEMLSLLRPAEAETLAIFAPSQSWKPFFDKIYGRAPIDLTFYAAVYSLSFDSPDPPNLSDWPSFYQATPAGSEATATWPPGEQLSPSTSKAVTFKNNPCPAWRRRPSRGGPNNLHGVRLPHFDRAAGIFSKLVPNRSWRPGRAGTPGPGLARRIPGDRGPNGGILN